MSKAVMELVGAKELQAALRTLAPKESKRIFKKVAVKFAAETRDALRSVEGVEEGNLKRATKSKSTKAGGAVVYVDRSGGVSGKGYHAHIHRKGTKRRTTRKGANRGVGPANVRMDRVVESQAARFVEKVGAPVLQELKALMNKAGAK